MKWNEMEWKLIKHFFSDDFSKRNHFIDFIEINSLERRNQTKPHHWPSFSNKKWAMGNFVILKPFENKSINALKKAITNPCMYLIDHLISSPKKSPAGLEITIFLIFVNWTLIRRTAASRVPPIPPSRTVNTEEAGRAAAPPPPPSFGQIG